MAKWHCTEPGVLALLGTQVSVRLDPKGGFRVYVGRSDRGHCHTLAYAKKEGEKYHAELVEIGAAEDV